MAMDAALKAIADPQRREILRLVHDRELTAGAVAGHFSVSRPAISQHLRVLIDADLVSVRREGTRRYYSARVDTVDNLKRFLDRFWEHKLDKLKTAAEAAERAKRSGGPAAANEEDD